MTSLRDYGPQIIATLQIGSPLLWGLLCAVGTRQGVLTGWKAWPPLLMTFPLLWVQGASIAGPTAWALPFACWLAAVLSLRSRHLTLRAAFLLATGVSTAALKAWQRLVP